MTSKLVLAAIMSTALVGTAVAQTATQPSTTAPTTMNRADTATTSAGSMWRASKLIGVNVYNEGNEKLGAISELIMDKEGKIANVVIGVGGFLGMGEHAISVAFDQLKWVNEPIRTSASDTRPTGGSGMTGAPATGTVGSTATGTTRATGKTWYPDHAVLSNATKDQLKAMPAFTY